MDLHSALTELAELNPRQSQVMELRYFGGLEERGDGWTGLLTLRG